MTEITRILKSIPNGEGRGVDELLPVVYDELRRLARQRLAKESPGQSLQATELVHEAYVRLMGTSDVDWNGAGHFFGAAAEAMRRILIDRARKRCTQKHGGDLERIPLNSRMLEDRCDERLIDLDEALDQLQAYDARKAEIVKLRFFGGLTNREAAAVLGISTATAERDWVFARAWLHSKIS